MNNATSDNNREFAPPVANTIYDKAKIFALSTTNDTNIGIMDQSIVPEEYRQTLQLVTEFISNNEIIASINANRNGSGNNDYLKLNREISYSNGEQHIIFWILSTLVKDNIKDEDEMAEFIVPDIFSVAKHTFGIKESRYSGIVSMFMTLEGTFYEQSWTEVTQSYDSAKPEHTIRTMMHYASFSDSYADWHSIWLSEAYVAMVEKPNKLSISEFIYRHFPLDFITVDEVLYWLDPQTSSLNSKDASFRLYDIIRNSINSDNFIWPLSSGARMTYRELKDSDQMQGELDIISLVREFTSTGNNDHKIAEVLKNKYTSSLKKQLDADYRRTAWAGTVTYAGKTNIKFCEPKIEDYITKSTNIQIAGKDDKQHDEAIVEYLKSVFPNDLHVSMMIDTAGMLEGVNTEHKAKFLIGEGRNGKSIWTDLLRYLFGDYFTQITTNTLRSSSGEGPSPILASCEGARVLVMPEANRDTPFDTSLFKSLTGNDHMTARKLRENARTFRAGFRLYCPCNSIPTLEHDFAIKQRFLAIPFVGMWLPQDAYSDRLEDAKKLGQEAGSKEYSKYEDQVEAQRMGTMAYESAMDSHMKNVHPQDAQFGDRILTWMGSIARMLVYDYYPMYAEDRNKHERYNHPMIKQETALRWNDNDEFARFMSEEYTSHEKSKMLIKDIRDLYHDKSGGKGKSKNLKDLAKKLRDLGYNISDDGKTCIGIRRESSRSFGSGSLFPPLPTGENS
jgi:P4 family phage/plasmid primase-like protien